MSSRIGYGIWEPDPGYGSWIWDDHDILATILWSANKDDDILVSVTLLRSAGHNNDVKVDTLVALI